MIKRSNLHLYHGGHKGAEAEFGKAAEAYGVTETTISFSGHKMERSKNVEELSDEQLEKGHVSMEFVFQVMGRRFARGKGLRRVIYSIFHMVKQGDELFAIGAIQDDKTVRGGTGWGVELAKLFNRPVHVYDQEQEQWFSWRSHEWQASDPRLPEGSFAATGTRNLTEAGSKAIRDLFQASLV